MNVNYCDLCGTIMKENNYYTLYIKDPSVTHFGSEEEYWNNVAKIQRDIKEICPTCKHIFDKMFELRIEKLYELTAEINKIYNVPSKKNPKERGNGKEKKK